MIAKTREIPDERITTLMLQLISCAITQSARSLEEETRLEVVKFSAGGFRDVSRVPDLSPETWRADILRHKELLLELLEDFKLCLGRYEGLVRDTNRKVLEDKFARIRDLREQMDKK